MFIAAQPTSYQDIFNIRGQMYHQAMALYPQARAQEFLLPLQQLNLHPGDILVDLLSGGSYLADYLPDDIQLHCLESSQALAQLCQQRGYQVSLFNNNHLPLPDQSVDKIVSIAGLHHIEDKVPLFKEMHRILKPGGQICIADVEQDSNIAHFLDDIVNRYSDTGHQGIYLGEHTRQELQQAGFSQIQTQRLHYNWHFPNEEAMISYCKLLFGLENGSVEQVRQGIKKHLNFEQQQSGKVELKWELHCLMGSYIPV